MDDTDAVSSLGMLAEGGVAGWFAAIARSNAAAREMYRIITSAIRARFDRPR
ncbi:MAG: hypothetical protein WC732_09910 [Candidatus Omnitrophota bacterium]